jgi:hypothetical protein
MMHARTWGFMLATLAGPAVLPAWSAGDVNPLTGTPLSLEQMHWTLEQARLEEQLQASLLNRRKFELERQRLDGAVPDGNPAPAAPGAGVLPLAAAPTASGMGAGQQADRLGQRVPLPTAAVRAPRTSASGHRRTAGAPPPAWTVVGARIQAGQWCLLVAESGELWPVCPGEWRRGHHVEAVTATAFTVDGVAHTLDVPATQLRRDGPTAATPEVDDAQTGGPPWPADDSGPALLEPGRAWSASVPAERAAGSGPGPGRGPGPGLISPSPGAGPTAAIDHGAVAGLPLLQP